jgi:hypothetical protein
MFCWAANPGTAPGQQETAVPRFDSTKSTELPSTIAKARVEASRRRFTFPSLRIHELELSLPAFHASHSPSRAMATGLIATNRVKSLVNQVQDEDFALL